MYHVQIISHCHGFSKALAYQLSSLILHPPQRVAVTLSVCCNPESDPGTMAMLRYFDFAIFGSVEKWTGKVLDSTPNVTLDVQVLEYGQMMNRSIGRNLAALSSTADLLWFCDADYHFGEGCLDALAELPLYPANIQRAVRKTLGEDGAICSEPACSFAEVYDGPKLFYPKTALFNLTKEGGDAYTARVTGPGIYDIRPEDFVPHHHKRAIGGIQIVPGWVARQYGYCNEPAHLKPASHWIDTKGDRTFRGILGTPGVPIDLPNLYRIRQSVEFQCDER